MKYFIIQNSVTGDFIQSEDTCGNFVTTFELADAHHFEIEYAAKDFIGRNNLDDAWNVVAMCNDEPTYFDLKTTIDKYKWHYFIDKDYPADNQCVLICYRTLVGCCHFSRFEYLYHSKQAFEQIQKFSNSEPYAWCELPPAPEER